MKRKVILLLVLILIFSLSGCKKEELSKEEELEEAVEQAVAEALAEVADEAEDGKPAKVRVDKSFGERKDDRTLQDFVDVFIAAGCEIDMKENLTSSDEYINRIIFYMDNKVVKIYEYDNAEVMKANATEDFWDAFNGRFALHTSGEEPIDIFMSVE